MIDINQYQAIIFDMDGLLLDTERLFIQAYEDSCNFFGIEADLSLMMSTYGTSETRTLEIFSKHFESLDYATKFLEKILNNYHHYISKNPIKLMPGVLEILNYIQSKKIPMAVATSTPYDSAITKLTDAGLIGFFNFVVAGDQVLNSKPDPEIYLRAANLLKTSPENCLAFEDSDNGVKSAYAAGINVIQIPDLASPSEEVVKFKHLILPSLFSVMDLHNSGEVAQ